MDIHMCFVSYSFAEGLAAKLTRKLRSLVSFQVSFLELWCAVFSEFEWLWALGAFPIWITTGQKSPNVSQSSFSFFHELKTNVIYSAQTKLAEN